MPRQAQRGIYQLGINRLTFVISSAGLCLQSATLWQWGKDGWTLSLHLSCQKWEAKLPCHSGESKDVFRDYKNLLQFLVSSGHLPTRIGTVTGWSWQQQEQLSWVEQSLTPHTTQYRSFRGRSSQPITWLILTKKAIQENKHTKTKYKSDKANNVKNSKNKLPWFSRLLRHSARKRGGLILQW